MFLFPSVVHAELYNPDVSTVHAVGVFMDGWMEVLLNEMILMQLLMDEINLSCHFGQG